jgi:acyl dehydratase
MLSIHEIAVGQTFACNGPRMTLEAFREFGALLGTDAPIHCDPAYAANTPFENVIAQGPLLLAPFETWLCDLFGEQAWCRSGQIRAKFLVPGPVGSTVKLEMTVLEIVEGKVSFDLHVRNGETLLAIAAAEITLTPPER